MRETTHTVPHHGDASGLAVDFQRPSHEFGSFHDVWEYSSKVDMTSSELRNLLSEPERIRALAQAVRAKIPPSDVDDLVQATLADALVSPEPPADVTALDRWLHGIARHKVADYYRRNRRHEPLDVEAAERLPADAAPESARDLLRWVHGELPQDSEAPRTLEWMLREASGDRLENIAKEHEMSAPAVRQRVSRLRRYLKRRWVLELAAALGLVVAVTGLYVRSKRNARPEIAPEVVERQPSTVDRVQRIRADALSACRDRHWQRCVEELDRAKSLDPAGDVATEIQQARIGATEAMRSERSEGPVPSSSADVQKPEPPRLDEHSDDSSDAKQRSPDTLQKAPPRKPTPAPQKKLVPQKSPKNVSPYSDYQQKAF